MLSLENLQLGYKGKVLLDSINLDIPSGKLTVLVGENGSGKSTLLRSLVRLHKPNMGKVKYGSGTMTEGENLGMEKEFDVEELSPTDFAKTIAYVSTEKHSSMNLSVYDLVATGRSPYTNWLNELGKEDKKIIEESLHLVGLDKLKHSPTTEISDGELQRASIARTLAQDCPIIILDEPTAFLDITNKRSIIRLLKNLCIEKNKTVILSSHDIETINSADNILLIKDGGLKSMTADEFNSDDL